MRDYSKIYLLFTFFLIVFCETANTQVVIPQASYTSCDNASITISVTGGNISSSYIWQDSITGWSNIMVSANINSINNDTLFLNNISTSFNGKKIRCLIDSTTDGSWDDTSNVTIITVYPQLIKPTISSNQSICNNSSADTLKMNNDFTANINLNQTI